MKYAVHSGIGRRCSGTEPDGNSLRLGLAQANTAGHTHNVRLVHLDGHLADGVGGPIDHLQEAGTAQCLRVDSPGQLTGRATHKVRRSTVMHSNRTHAPQVTV